MDEKDVAPDNVTPIKDTNVVVVKKHIGRHKKKYGAASVIAILTAALQLYPLVCPLLPFQVQCAKTVPIAQFGVTKLQELSNEKDAGN